MTAYADFIERKTQLDGMHGFEGEWLPDFLFPFQHALVDWALKKGRAAIFADCGLGKTPMQLVWAENVKRKTGKPVLILTPLAVSYQTEEEAEKFGIEAATSRTGKPIAGITITNYDRLHHFKREDYGGVVCDESSAIKSFDGVRRALVTEFVRKTPYRLLCTATAAPNDYIELGTSSEALGYLGFMDMLSRFFTNNEGTGNTKQRYRQSGMQWRFKGHAEDAFWRWVSSWARAMRKPSDFGFGTTDSCFRRSSTISTSWRRGHRARTPCSTCRRSASERSARNPGARSPSAASSSRNCLPRPSRRSLGVS
jgi:hypothetical protein